MLKPGVVTLRSCCTGRFIPVADVTPATGTLVLSCTTAPVVNAGLHRGVSLTGTDPESDERNRLTVGGLGGREEVNCLALTNFESLFD